jgi:hypothetical protein
MDLKIIFSRKTKKRIFTTQGKRENGNPFVAAGFHVVAHSDATLYLYFPRRGLYKLHVVGQGKKRAGLLFEKTSKGGRRAEF